MSKWLSLNSCRVMLAALLSYTLPCSCGWYTRGSIAFTMRYSSNGRSKSPDMSQKSLPGTSMRRSMNCVYTASMSCSSDSLSTAGRWM